MAVILPIVVILLVVFLSGKKTSQSQLRPFEFSGFTTEETSQMVGSKFNLSKLVVILIFMISIPQILPYLLESSFRNGTVDVDMYVIAVQILQILTSLVLLLVILSLKDIKYKGVLVALILLQTALFVYNNFFKETQNYYQDGY
jgi:hypothetical protein